MHIIKLTQFSKIFIFLIIGLFNFNTYGSPLRPDQRTKDKKNDFIESKKTPVELIKWPRANLYELGLHFSNSRIDGFQIANDTTGTLVSETNMALSIQYFNWRKNREYDFSAGLNIESIQMRSEISSVPIDNSQVLAIGINVMGRYLVYDNLYLKSQLGLQDKLFYAPNAGLTGYEISKPMIPFISFGAAVLFSEIMKIKISFEGNVSLYQSSEASNYKIDSGQGYEIKFFSMWPRSGNQIITDFFYTGRTQNTTLIRTEEQKIGFGVKYQF